MNAFTWRGLSALERMSSLAATPRIDLAPAQSATSRYWLFSPVADVAAFGGSTLLALILLWLGGRWGLLTQDAPEWAWITGVLLIDVAHVHATNYKVYFDLAELRRRPYLYALAPLIGYTVGVALYSETALTFWRVLAYLAVFHFVRQQYGWVRLYRARAGETDKLGEIIDTAAIYLATLYPLAYWHAHLPRHFWWFVPHDFAAGPAWLANILWPLYILALAAYAVRALARAIVYSKFNPGKDLVLLTTAVCWYVGIVTYNSDYAFTVTNVIIHGVPYFFLTYWHTHQRRTQNDTPALYRGLSRNVPIFLSVLWLLAFAEEMLWDKTIWHERAWLFGTFWDADAWKMWLVPLLALPQITHYVLDGFIWRRRTNPTLDNLATNDTNIHKLLTPNS